MNDETTTGATEPDQQPGDTDQAADAEAPKTVEAAAEAAPSADTADEANEAAEVDDQAESPSRREARYRRQLRQAQAERDNLAAKIEAMQRAEVERLISDRLDRPDAIWALGLDLAAVTDPDTGAPVADKLYATVDRLKAEFGIVGPDDRKKRDLVVPGEGMNSHDPHKRNSWERAFRV